jgi:hypothetical protein
MSLTSSATALVAVQELPMSDWAFGGIAFAGFLLLLGVLWTFRNTAARHDTPVPVTEQARRAAHGPTDPAADPGVQH